jgi:hypothetical protein
MMGREFEWFCNPQGKLTTSTGVPYNELFSTEEIRRLTFTRFLASKNQELFPVIDERQTSEQSIPAADSPMSRWLSLGVEFFWYPPLVMATFLTNCSRLSPWGLWLESHDRRIGQADSQSVIEKSID